MSLEKQIDKFFEEFPDDKRGYVFYAGVLALMFFILMGIFSNLRTNADITFACTIYIFMVIFVAVVSGMDKLKERNTFIAMISPSGKWKNFGLVPLIIGGIFGYFMVSNSQTIGLSFLQLSGTNAFFFIVIVAPIVEEYFFRGTLFPSFRQQLKVAFNSKYASIIALIVSNIGFGAFHYYVYGANMQAVYIAAVLGTVYTIGNYVVKATNFSVGAHMMNNYLLWAAAGGVLFG